MFKSIMASQNDIRMELGELRTNHTGTEKAVSDLVCKISGLVKIMQELSAKFNEIHALSTTVTSLERTVSRQNAKLAELEGPVRRSNLVLFGIHEDPNF